MLLERCIPLLFTKVSLVVRTVGVLQCSGRAEEDQPRWGRTACILEMGQGFRV